MEEMKNLDRLFQEKFRDYEATPPPDIWTRISATLHGDKRKRKSPVWWWWAAGTAAGIALFWFLQSPLQTSTPPVQTLPQHSAIRISAGDNSGEHQIPPVTIPNSGESTPVYHATKEQLSFSPASQGNLTENHSTGTPEKQRKDGILPLIQHRETLQPMGSLAGIHMLQNELSPNMRAFTGIPDKLHTIVWEGNVPKEDINRMEVVHNLRRSTNGDDRWSVSPVIAPTYMDYLSKDLSNIDAQFNDNPKHGSVTQSYGLTVNYQINDRYSLELGAQQSDYAFVTEDIYISPTGRTPAYSGLLYDSDASYVNLSPAPVTSPPGEFSSGDLGDTSEKGRIIQYFSYIEIPLNARVNLFSGTYSVSAVGGFSTLLLHKNEVYMQTDNFTDKIGRSALNSWNISGNAGVEIERKLYDKLNISLTPMVKFFGHTYNSSYPFYNPYSVGIYSGLKYKF